MRKRRTPRASSNATEDTLAVVLAILGAALGLYLGYVGGDGVVWRKIMLPMEVEYEGELTGVTWMCGLTGIAAGVVAGVVAGVLAGRNLGLLLEDKTVGPRLGRGIAAVGIPVLGAVGSWWGAMGVLVLDYAVGGLGGSAIILLPVGGAIGFAAGLALGHLLLRLLPRIGTIPRIPR